MLRNLCLKGYGLKLTPMSWLRQVRSIELSTKLTVSETLGVLASTMNLTSLQLDYFAAEDNAFSLSLISLPKLARLELNLSDTLSPGATLLEHMLIPPSCAVTFSAKQIQRGEIDKKSKFELSLKPYLPARSVASQTNHLYGSTS